MSLKFEEMVYHRIMHPNDANSLEPGPDAIDPEIECLPHM